MTTVKEYEVFRVNDITILISSEEESREDVEVLYYRNGLEIKKGAIDKYNQKVIENVVNKFLSKVFKN